MFKEELETLVNVLANVPELPAKYEAELLTEKETSYNEGYKAGVSSASNGEDKVYSQEDMDNVVKALEEKITAKDEEIVKINDAVEGKITLALSEMVLEIEADLQAAQDSENATEAEFKAKLEARKV